MRLDALPRDGEIWREEAEEDLSSVVLYVVQTYLAMIFEHVRSITGVYGLLFIIIQDVM